MTTPLDALARLAATQHGVVTTGDAEALGLTRSQLRTLVRRGEWRRPVNGVLVAAAAPNTWAQECSIEVRRTGGVLSHRAAARLHGLDGFDDAAPELTVATNRARAETAALIHRSSRLDAADLTLVRGIPVTSVARTLVDLGAVVDDDLVEQAVDDALRRGHSQRWIQHTLDRVDRPGPSGTASLRRVLARPDRRGPLPDSVFERLVERGTRRAGLPPAVRQHEVRDDDGELVARIDVAWPELLIGVEAHSARWHTGAGPGRVDRHRGNRLSALGWSMIYAGWTDVDDPTTFVAVLREAHRTRTLRP